MTQVIYDSSGTLSAEPQPPWCISADYQLYLYSDQDDGYPWRWLGSMEPYPLTREELLGYTAQADWVGSYRLREITDAYILRLEDDAFYLAFQTKDGHTLLAQGWEGAAAQGDCDDASLRWMVRLESGKEYGQAGAGLIERSLRHQLGEDVGCFAAFLSDRLPGPLPRGLCLRRGGLIPAGAEPGFALFEAYDNGTFRLLFWRRYENADIALSDPFYVDGRAYRVLLCDHPDLALIT